MEYKEEIPIYNSRERLICSEFPDRHLGIVISEPFESDDKLLCDIEGARPSINTLSFGNVINYNDWKARAKQYTRKIIQSIDTVIMELEIHKKRLETDLIKIDNYKTECPKLRVKKLERR